MSLCLCGSNSVALADTTPGDDPRLIEFFEKKVRPILVTNCYNCHSASTNAKGGLRVDDRTGLIQGGNSGPAVVPGKPEKSLLLQSVKHEADAHAMPPKKHLTAEEIADLTQWIKDGVAWPKTTIAVTAPNAKFDQLRKEHWAWQPVQTAKLPAVRNAAWPHSDIDRFILAKLEQNNLAPVGDADRLTLLRRVTFDLTGLPPTHAEIETALSDKSPDWYEKLVDRLLASPAFGERWGRHWLDVARYGESTGSGRNVPYPHAWRYRNYVIDAFNADKPYDQFIREQIAGDLLPANTQQERDEHLIATGFLALGQKDVNQRFKVRFIMDNIDEQIDTVTRSVLALTASCARCHDHKFDPIPTMDYYALAGIFHSSDLCAGVRNKMGGGGLDYYDTTMLLPLGENRAADPKLAEKLAQARKALAEAQKELNAIRGKPEGKELGENGQPKEANAQGKVRKLQADLVNLTDPATQGDVALGVREGRNIGDTEIRIRGEAEKLGPLAPRGFLSLVNVPDAAKVDPKHSGRLELAQWLTSEKNPLTQRVMANRVWHHLFGRGLVGSVDNFGVTGEKPSHPELLDYLAQQFVRDGWSVKKLVRMLVLTRTYQLSSAELGTRNAERNADPQIPVAPHSEFRTPSSIDPSNRLLWSHSARRLEAEEIRDAMLAAAGTLDSARPAAPAKDLKVIEMRNNGPEAKRLEDQGQASRNRSVYLPLLRRLTPRSLEVFDFAEQGMVTGSRDTTTVVTQALYLLNDPFVKQQSRALADRLLRRTDIDDAGRIAMAYQQAMSRPATAREIERATRYLSEWEAADPKAAWASFCQALLASAEFRYVR